jgi:S-adenosylmethionine decarboxylase
MNALHLTADLYGCRCAPQWLADAAQVQAWGESALAHAAGVLPGACFAPAAGTGLSGAWVLPGVHMCIHTDAGRRSASTDVFVSERIQDGARLARFLVDALVERLEPEWTEQRSLTRGDEG